MEARPAKHVFESKTTQIQILMPEHINGYNRLFGGKLVEWIDVVAAVAARRHSGCNVTTACIDNLQFQSGAYVNSTIVIEGQLTWVGRTSMEVRVDTFVEELDGCKSHINRAYLIMVALDEEENPAQVPGLLCDTEEEKAEFESGVLRAGLRKERRRKKF
ncbi:MAG: acyl-CoA thioesterase [Oscillospiraceae bacterium]|nr:acyl-CoA thioesterase [Oscillospiraceae bacterium]